MQLLLLQLNWQMTEEGSVRYRGTGLQMFIVHLSFRGLLLGAFALAVLLAVMHDAFGWWI